MRIQERYTNYFFILGHLVLLLGLVSSKALISIGAVVILISALCILVQRPELIMRAPRQIIGFLILFMVPLISGIWSSHLGDWISTMLNKIMLPGLALAYWVMMPKLNVRQYLSLSLTQIGLIFLASWYSIGLYLIHPQSVQTSYLQAKTLRVLLSNDHLHFSLLVFIVLVFIPHDWEKIKTHCSKFVQTLVISIGIWLIVYVHILGAKTGLLMLYAGGVIYVFKNFTWTFRSSVRLLIIPALCTVVMLAYRFIPTFKNRVHYTLFDFNQYAHGSIINGLTDGARVLSWKAGLDVIKDQPILGVGYGDLDFTFTQWHKEHSSHLEAYNWLQPSNEWLMHWSGSGLWGMLLFSLALCLIYWNSTLKSYRLFNILFFAQVGMMWYEVNLSNQIGIALFVWSLSWMEWGRVLN